MRCGVSTASVAPELQTDVKSILMHYQIHQKAIIQINNTPAIQPDVETA
jgi:hypothetical protein